MIWKQTESESAGTKLTGGAKELIKPTFAGLDNLLWVVWGSA